MKHLLLKILSFTLLATNLLLSGCATYDYKHSVYNLAEDRIPAFDVKGTVTLENTQTSTVMQKSSSSGQTYRYTYQQITDGYNRQFLTEIQQRGRALSKKGNKTLKTSISEFNCETRGLNNWVYRCVIKGEIVTGDGRRLAIDYKHGAPIVSPIQNAFDGMIAIAVENALKDKTMLDYLAR